jgi:Sec-independent protein translocase protein TatA
MNVGPAEVIVILIIAILVVGPQRMMELARAMGRLSRQLRDLSNEFVSAIHKEVELTKGETDKIGEDVKDVMNNITAPRDTASEES